MSETKPVVAAVAELAAEFARRLTATAMHAIDERGRFAFAVPGGSVARAFLPALAGAPIDWRRVDLFWCDERCVPPDDPESNFGVARSLWLGDAPDGATPRVHPLYGARRDASGAAAPDASQAATEATAEVARVLGSPPVLDLALLGVGEDGHVASLFPGHAALEETATPVIAIRDAPKPPPCRLTMTLPTLTRARSVCVAAFGATKSDVMRAALEDPGSPLPVARVVRGARDPWIFLDPAAASRLGRR